MERQQIQATADSDHVEYGTAEIKSYTSQQVFAKSIQRLLLFWGLAIVSILLPVVHFVLVPLFFILGIVLALKARRLRTEMIAAEIHCPHCKTPMRIEKAIFEDYYKEICQSCAWVVKISPSTKS